MTGHANRAVSKFWHNHHCASTIRDLEQRDQIRTSMQGRKLYDVQMVWLDFPISLHQISQLSGEYRYNLAEPISTDPTH